MSRVEYLTPEGLRVDGRRPNEHRRVRSRVGVLANADGSAYYEQGNTKCIATISGPREAEKRSDAEHNKAVVMCDIGMATFSTTERRKRSKGDRRIMEMCFQLRQVFEASILLELYPRSQIVISVQVLQADGGVLPAIINAASLAVIDAGIALKDFVVACNAGYISKTPFLDINHIEDGANGPCVPIAIHPRTSRVVLALVDSKVTADALPVIMQTAITGCHQIHQSLKLQLHEQSQDMIQTRGVDIAS
eukprot:c9510_g1_i1.p1 GENE.c9510_g1_i1~~c9510_g1_i1.p1  ORF type:complete len:249 (+),score=44.04 c9510_g1_i1:33-779(+)